MDSSKLNTVNKKLKKPLSEVLKQTDKIKINFPKYPTQIHYASYCKICQKANISKFEGLEFSLYPSEGKTENKKKEKKSSFQRMVYEFKPSTVNLLKKEGGCLSSGEPIQSIMKIFYRILQLLGLCTFIFFCSHIYSLGFFTLRQGEFIMICFSGLCFLSGGLGVAKLSKKSKASFGKINTSLAFLLINSGLFVGMKFCPLLRGEQMNNLCEKYFIIIALLGGIAAIVSDGLIAMNCLLSDFYAKYNMKKEEISLLENENGIEMENKTEEV